MQLLNEEGPGLHKRQYHSLQAAAFTMAKRLLWVAEWGPFWAWAAKNPRVSSVMVCERYAKIFATLARKEA
jgi:hypothetical protein